MLHCKVNAANPAANVISHSSTDPEMLSAMERFSYHQSKRDNMESMLALHQMASDLLQVKQHTY